MTYRIGLLRFCLWFVGLTVGLPLLISAITYVTGFDLNSAGVAIIPMMLAALQEGMAFARIELRRPENGEAWRISVRLAALGAAISAVFGVIFFVIVPQAFAALGPVGLALIVLASFVVYLLVGRIFFALGARNFLKSKEKSSGKETT